MRLTTLSLVATILLFGASAQAAEVTSYSRAQRSWALATYGLLTELNRTSHSVLGTMGHTAVDQDRARESLKEWWGIASTQDLLLMLSGLSEDKGGHRHKLQMILKLTPELRQDLKRLMHGDPSEMHRVEFVEKHVHRLNEHSLLAWDLCRYIYLASQGVLIGYLSEEDAWELIMPVAQRLQKSFKSWRGLGEDYLLGRRFWSAAETDKTGQRMEEGFDWLMKSPESPWRTIPWDLDLSAPVPAKAE